MGQHIKGSSTIQGEGPFTFVGTYVLEPGKVRRWIIPDLTGFPVPTSCRSGRLP